MVTTFDSNTMDGTAGVRRSQFQVWEYEHEENHHCKVFKGKSGQIGVRKRRMMMVTRSTIEI